MEPAKNTPNEALLIQPTNNTSDPETLAQVKQRTQKRLDQSLTHPTSGSKIQAGMDAIGEEAIALGMLRTALGITQTELAARLGVAQSHTSQTEARKDIRISTLNDYIAATGGELILQARYNNETYQIDYDQAGS